MKRATRWFIAVLGALSFAAAVRTAATRGFEYDELWTLQHYAEAGTVGSILGDVRVPNNHPLHSLLVRLTTALAGTSELSVRTPALLAGGILMALWPVILWRTTRDETVTALGVAWLYLHPALWHFMQTARGYSLQTLFLVIAAWALWASRVCSRQGSRAGPRRGIDCGQPTRQSSLRRSPQRICAWNILFAAASWLAMLTIPSAVLFLAALLIADVLERVWQRRDAPRAWRLSWALVWVSIGFLLWYWADDLIVARAQFGKPVRSIADSGMLAWEIGVRLIGPGLLGLMVPGLIAIRSRPWRVVAVGMLFVPILLAFVTAAGPTRAYLPLVPAAVVIAALAGRWLNRLGRGWARVAGGVGLAVVPLLWLSSGARQWQSIDWSVAAFVPFQHLKLPQAYVNFAATDGYLIRHYHWPSIGVEIAGRVPQAARFTLAEVNSTQSISALQPGTFASRDIPCRFDRQVQHQGLSLALIDAERVDQLTSQPANALYFAALGPGTPARVNEWQRKLRDKDPASQWLYLNGFLYNGSVAVGEASETAAMVLVTDASSLSLDAMKELMAAARGQLRFYVTAPDAAGPPHPN